MSATRLYQQSKAMCEYLTNNHPNGCVKSGSLFHEKLSFLVRYDRTEEAVELIREVMSDGDIPEAQRARLRVAVRILEGDE